MCTVHRNARESSEGFSPTKRRDYIEWITEAWLAEGKSRDWKYEQ